MILSWQLCTISQMIKELLNRIIADVSCATFYRLFDYIKDVLEYLCDSIFYEIGHELSEYKEEPLKNCL